jgi:pimeloyl-ACP methyl ester carboxylesterase
MPVRLLRGDCSPEPARAVAARLAELLPFAQLTTLRGAVHMQPVTSPGSVIAALPSWLHRQGQVPALATAALAA